MTALSVVIPVYGCADCLPALAERLAATLDQITPSWEVVLVDDRSTDGAWTILCRLAEMDPRYRAIRLSRNFGQHIAITAGLARSQGDHVVVMDCDLQDPPEQIPLLYAKAREGNDLVFARRIRRQPRLRGLVSRLYFRAINRMSGADIDGAFGTLSVLSRKVVQAFLTVHDADRLYIHVLFWLGFKSAVVDYVSMPRHAGRSSYTLMNLLRHGFAGVFFQTTTLLRFVVYTGFFVAALGVLLALYFASNAFSGHPPEGFTSIAVLILVIGGMIIISTGVTGLYIGAIFKQVKDRPLYVVDETTDR